jgi:hypothetical protein
MTLLLCADWAFFAPTGLPSVRCRVGLPVSTAPVGGTPIARSSSGPAEFAPGGPANGQHEKDLGRRPRSESAIAAAMGSGDD